MLVEKEFYKEAPAKTGTNWKGNYQNKYKSLAVPRKCMQ